MTYLFTRRALVRTEYSDEAVWRAVLGQWEPLRPFAVDGPIDAPDWLPSGASAMLLAPCICARGK